MIDEPAVTEPDASESAPVETPSAEPDHAPEAEAETPDAVETPEGEEAPESDDTQTLEPEPVADLFDAQPLTPERIAKMRVSKEERALLLQEHEDHQQTKSLLDSFGGQFEIDALSPMAKLLAKASASPDEIDAAFTKLATANQNVAQNLVEGITYGVLNTPELLEPMFKQVYGDNASIANVKRLLAYDKAGIIDHDGAVAYLTGDDDIVEAHAKEIAELKQQVIDAKNGREVTPAATNAVQEWDADYHKVGPKELDPYIKQLHWEGADTLIGLVVEALQTRLKVGEQYTQTAKYLTETGRYRNGADIVPMASANLNVISKLARAQGQELLRKVQADIRKISENSRNAIVVKRKQDEVAAQAATDTAPPANLPPRTLEQRLADKDAKFKGKILQTA